MPPEACAARTGLPTLTMRYLTINASCPTPNDGSGRLTVPPRGKPREPTATSFFAPLPCIATHFTRTPMTGLCQQLHCWFYATRTTRTARRRTPRMPAFGARKPRPHAQPTSPCSVLSRSTFSFVATRRFRTNGPARGTPVAGVRVRITAAWAATAASVGKLRTSTCRRACARALRFAARMRK